MARDATGSSRSYKEEQYFFQGASSFGASSASVETDATSIHLKPALQQEYDPLSHSFPMSHQGCYAPLTSFSSPERPPATGSAQLPFPEPSLGLLQETQAPVWERTDPSISYARSPWLSFDHIESFQGRGALLPGLAASSLEDESSDSPASVDVRRPPVSFHRRLKLTSSDDPALLTGDDRQKCWPLNSPWGNHEQSDVAQPSPSPAGNCKFSPPWSASDSKKPTQVSHSWANACEKPFTGMNNKQCAASGQCSELLSCPSFEDSTSASGQKENSNMTTWMSREAAAGSEPPATWLECAGDDEDGRLWLDRLEKLRSGASKEEYKRARSRVVDTLIRRAASYPKVSGIYFDKHQVKV